jgi:hypothetical protein
VIFPHLEQNYTILIQVDKLQSKIYFSRFPLVDENYLACTTQEVSPKLIYDDTRLIGDSIYLIKALNETHTKHLIQSLPLNEKLYYFGKQVVAFMNLNDETGLLSTVICDYTDTTVNCTQVHSFRVNTTAVVFINYQIFEEHVCVYLQSGIISLSLVKDEKETYTYEKNFKFLQYFHGEWYGISDTDSLCVLKVQVERNMFGDDYLNLVETYVYPVAVGLEYRDLTSTENYLIAKYKDFINNKTGVSIFAFTNDTFFGDDQENLPNSFRTDKARLLQRPADTGRSLLTRLRGLRGFWEKENLAGAGASAEAHRLHRRREPEPVQLLRVAGTGHHVRRQVIDDPVGASDLEPAEEHADVIPDKRLAEQNLRTELHEDPLRVAEEQRDG